MDKEGWYCGKRLWEVDPSGGGLGNWNFTIQKESLSHNGEKLTMEFRVKAIDDDGKEHKLPTRSWSYIKKTNSWFFESGAFTKDRD